MIQGWTNKDAKFLQKFLNSETGRKLTSGFKGTEPDLDESTIEARALQAAEFAQWRKDKAFIQNALELQPEEPEPDRGIPVEELDVKE